MGHNRKTASRDQKIYRVEEKAGLLYQILKTQEKTLKSLQDDVSNHSDSFDRASQVADAFAERILAMEGFLAQPWYKRVFSSFHTRQKDEADDDKAL